MVVYYVCKLICTFLFYLHSWTSTGVMDFKWDYYYYLFGEYLDLFFFFFWRLVFSFWNYFIEFNKISFSGGGQYCILRVFLDLFLHWVCSLLWKVPAGCVRWDSSAFLHKCLLDFWFLVCHIEAVVIVCIGR